MPRQRRINIAGGLYHVMQRGIERREIFLDEGDRREFVQRLSEGLKETGSKCYGWALMPNHFHLIVQTGKKTISDLMRKVLSGYVTYYNQRHRRVGHLYQNRYKAILCNEEDYLLELVRYVHLNPVRGDLVKGMTELEGYEWSGHSVLVGRRKAEWQSTGEVLERFGARRGTAERRYKEYVAEGVKEGSRDDLTGGGLKRSAGGLKEVLAMRRAKERWRSDERVLGDGAFVETVLKEHDEELLRREYLKRSGWDLNKLIEHVSTLMKVSKEDLKRKGRENAVTDAKGLIAYWGRKELGTSGAEIGEHMGVSRQAVAKLYYKGQKYANDHSLKLTN